MKNYLDVQDLIPYLKKELSVKDKDVYDALNPNREIHNDSLIYGPDYDYLNSGNEKENNRLKEQFTETQLKILSKIFNDFGEVRIYYSW